MIISKAVAQNPLSYLHVLRAEQVTVLNQTPTAFANLIHEELKAESSDLQLKYVIFGGEALKPIMLKAWKERYPETRLINMFGITETTVHVTFKEITAAEITGNISNIGTPIPTLKTYILDQDLKLLPRGVPGELCVAGEGVGRGYLNRPELTRLKFIENPYHTGERLYRSGDLAKLLPNGEMEYLGRIDKQVKIRGFRIELGEIESRLLKFPGITEAVVIVREDVGGDKSLCAYFVTAEVFSLTALKEFLAADLPDYMLPAYFVPLERMPLTSNGKVNYKSLPDPLSSLAQKREYAAPTTELESRLAEVWAAVLELEQVGLNDEFSEIGGDSIKAVRLANQINQRLETSLQIADIYTHQTVKELAVFISEQTDELGENDLERGLKLVEELQERVLADPSEAELLPDDYVDFFPLSPIQQGMLLYTTLRPDEPVYHDQFVFQIDFKRFDAGLLQKTMEMIVEKHAIFRTIFPVERFYESIQVVMPGMPPALEIEDFRQLDQQAQQTYIRDYLERDLLEKFVLNTDVLWRMRVYQLDEVRAVLIMTVHHAILDGWSVASLMSEFHNIYSDLVEGKEVLLEQLQSDYKDYVAIGLSRKASTETREFWKRTLAGYSRSKLPFNYSGKRINNYFKMKKHKHYLSKELLDRLETQTKVYGCSLKDLCLSAYLFVMSIITTEKNLLTGVVTHDRPVVEDGDKILGCFLNTIPIYLNFDQELTKSDLIKMVTGYLIEAKYHEIFLADIAQLMGETAGAENPLFDTVFNFTDFHIASTITKDSIVLSEEQLDLESNEMTNTLFDLEFSKTLQAAMAWIKYSPNYFAEQEIATALQMYIRTLEKFAQVGDERLRAVDLISEEEKRWMLFDFNATQAEYPFVKTIDQLFVEQVERTPEAIAVSYGGEGMTYLELNSRVNQLAHLLRDRGVRSGDHLGLIAERGFLQIIGLLGILKSGAVYLPIDPEYPTARKRYILENSAAKGVLVDAADVTDFPQMILMEEEILAHYSTENPVLVKDSTALAYVIYTSGSTGEPKGVMIAHHSAVNLINWVNTEYQIGSNDRLLFITSVCFDLSVYDIFGTLAAGASIVLADKHQVQNPEELYRLMVEEQVTFWDSVPTTMNHLVNLLEELNVTSQQTDLRLVFLSGDWIPVQLPERLHQFFPRAQVISLGGATEGTVWSIYHPIEEVSEFQTSIPYGRPLNNNYFYVLDENLEILPRGVAGELCIGGIGVALGYINNPGKTARSFVVNKFLSGAERLYRTGDLGRFLADGNLEFLGRRDHQVKIRGFRVELGEIEHHLMRHPEIKETAVVARDAVDGRFLCAYIVSERELSVSEMRSYLNRSLPDYMIPSYFVPLSALPLTTNGKIDYRALPEVNVVSTDRTYIPPRNQREAELAVIWSEILGIEQIGVDQDFFELGGHSLKAVKIVSKIRKTFGVEISLRAIFETSTIAELAELISRAEGASLSEIQRLPVQDYYELSPAQRRLWILDQLEEESIAYNLAQVYPFELTVELETFERVCQQIIERHSSLRTTFVAIDGEPKQRIDREAIFVYQLIDLQELADPEQTARKEINEQITTPFDLGEGPLYRVVFIRLAKTYSLILLVMHHIIADGWSLDIFQQEFLQLYTAELSGQKVRLPELPVEYVDYAAWQNQLLTGELLAKHRNYWHQYLQGELIPLQLPFDYPYNSRRNNLAGSSYQLIISKKVQSDLHQLAYRQQASMFMILLAAFNLLLTKLTNQQDILIGVPMAGREVDAVKELIGFFLNTVVFRHQVNLQESFNRLIVQVRENTLKNLEYQSYPYELLLDELGIESNTHQPTITSVFFNMLNFEHSGQGQLTELAERHQEIGNVMKYDLGLYVCEYENGIFIECDYRIDLFKRSTIEYIMEEFAGLLEQISLNPNLKLREYALFDKTRLIDSVRQIRPMNSFREFPKVAGQTVVKRFEEQVELYAERVAVKTNSGELTYRELNHLANGVAVQLLEQTDPRYRLSQQELIRYSRQMLIEGWGIAEQEKLKKTTVFVAGAGGSASPLITQLALLGIGKIIICDPDQVELSNLNRQFLHDESRIGMNKAYSAKLTVERINPGVEVAALSERITRENVAELVGEAAIIFDNVDQLEAKFVLSEYAVFKGIAQIISSMIDLNAYAAIFHTPYTPCFHCLYDRGKLQELAEIRRLRQGEQSANPVSSPALFLATGFVCNEAIKILLGIDQPAYNKYFLFNQRTASDLVHSDGYLAITYPFSQHFRAICKEQGFDWDEGWRGKFLEELDIWPDPDCPVCSQRVRPELTEASLEAAAVFQSELTEETVALLFGHGAEMIVGILAALKTGKIYVPLDPEYPVERLLFMLEDAGCSVLMTDDQNLALAKKLVKQGQGYLKLLNISSISLNPERVYPDLNLKIPPDQPAYILYTSGSTGQPKGVYQSQRNLLHFIRTYTNSLQISETDRLTLLSTYSFDAAIMDIFGALLNGAALYPYSIKENGHLQGLVQLLQDEAITIYHSIPTVYRYLIDSLTDETFSALRLIVLGGEAVWRQDVEAFKRFFSIEAILINGLGPTESTVTMQYLIDQETECTRAAVPVGKPVSETEVKLVDEDGNEVGVYGIGELVFQSSYLALGYWNRPELTKQVFKETGELRYYHSGDLGRLLADGNIEFIGRKDLQTKLRGYRIELREIETILEKHPEVHTGLAHLVDRADGEKELAVYYLPHKGAEIDEAELRGGLQAWLPDYMLPTYIVQLTEIPRTVSGKVDYRALPGADSREESSRVYTAPRSQLEIGLIRILQEVLGLEKIGIRDNFFELGGHSLKAVAFISRVFREMNLQIPLKQIFINPTIEELAEYAQGIIKSVYESIPVSPIRELYPASAAQRRLFIVSQLGTEQISYNLPAAFLISGELKRERLEEAFIGLIQRHETLRTSFELVDGELMQRVHQRVEFQLQTLQVFDKGMLAQVMDDFIQPFDLKTAPLFRVGLVEVGEEYLLMVDLHHIIADGTSQGILMQEFIRLYQGEELPPLRIQYKDVAVWQEEFMNSTLMQRQERYWLEVFSGELPLLDLPTDYPRPPIMSHRGERYSFKLSRELSAQLDQLVQKTGITLYMALLAAYNILLTKYTHQEDIIVGSPIAGRPHADLEPLIGMFVNTIALRNHPQSSSSVSQFLAEVREQALNGYEYQDYPFDMLVEKLDLRRDMSRNPLFDTMFVLQNIDGESINSELDFRAYQFAQRTTRFDLYLTAVEAGENLFFNLDYSTALFKAETTHRLANHLENIIAQMVRDPEILIGQIEILTPEERHCLLQEWNQTQVSYPEELSLSELFGRQVRARGQQTALVYADQSLSYQELNKKADQLARHLLKIGVQPEEIVGLMPERSLEMVVGMLGILKAGAAYLPIDPEGPIERLEYVLADSGVQVVLTQNRLIDQISTGQRVLAIDLTNDQLYRGETGNLVETQNGEQLAYVIYTSGSTGQPKGVMIEQRAVHNFIVGMTDLINFDPEQSIVSLTTISFDIFVLETLLPLISGLTVVIATPQEQLLPTAFNSLLMKHQIDIVQTTPSRMKVLISASNQLSALQTVKQILLGGEPLPESLLRELQALTTAQIYNLYGPTETTVWSTLEKLSGEGEISIGRPIANTQIYIVNPQQQLTPINVSGELWIGGAGLARGYLNHPELTTEQFIPNPFNSAGRVYRTGDLVRWRLDGKIEFLGRRDTQVKIRGYRIECGEIEARLLSHPAIQEAAVIDRADEAGDKYLSAFVVIRKDLNQELTLTELRSHLARTLPDYMIPSYFISLEALPLTVHGKLDYQGLPAIDTNLLIDRTVTAPRNPLEEKLAAIWTEVLGMTGIGINDSFFELGGHSLKATQILMKVYQQLQLEIPLGEIFYNPTIAQLAAYLQNLEQSYQKIERIAEQEAYPLSSAQKRLFMLNQLKGDDTRYNIPTVLKIEGELDVEQFRQAYQTLVQRHEILRTTFGFKNGEPVQIIHPVETGWLEYAVLSEAEIQCKLTEFVQPFDLQQGPLIRMGLYRVVDLHYLIVDLHHIITDAASNRILIEDFVRIYAGRDLAELKIQYRDFAVWQNQLLNSAKIEEQKQYWVEKFTGEIPLLELPTDYPRQRSLSLVGDRFYFDLDAELTGGLKQLAAEQQVTLYMSLLAIYNVTLAKYTGQEDIVVGSPIAGRSHPDLSRMIGMFANTLALRNRPIGSLTFVEFLQAVKENVLHAFENQDYQFELLVDSLDLPRDLTRNPLFETMLVLQDGAQGVKLSESGLQISPYLLANRTAKFDLTLQAMEVAEEISLGFEYRTDLFKPETIRRLAVHFTNIVREVVQDVDLRLAEIEMISPMEREFLLKGLIGEPVNYPTTATVNQLFKIQMEQNPDGIALVLNDEQLTYAELNQRSKQLAWLLRKKGVRPNQIVGLLTERSLEMVIGIIAVVKAGGAYLPIDPEYPRERIEYMLTDSKTGLLVSDEFRELNFPGEWIVLTDLAVAEKCGELPELNQPTDLLYIIYTSGTTGRPKGVMIEQRNLVRLFFNDQFQFDFSQQDIWTLFHSYCFDFSVWEMYGALLFGGKLIIVPRQIAQSPAEYRQLLVRERVTVLNQTPTAFYNLITEELQFGAGDLALRYVIFGGEALQPGRLKEWAVRYPETRLINMYGITETTVHVTFKELSAEDIQREISNIGRPIPTLTCWILDHNLRLVPGGVAGELCVGGAGLARGYLNRPELTAEKFIQHPYLPGERLYRSGDKVRLLETGELEYLGRIDQQVKIRGFRIEPAEIESQILTHPQIAETAVLVREDAAGQNELAAYLVTVEEISATELRAHLARTLPDYMIPGYFIRLPELPLTASGKLDRSALLTADSLLDSGRDYLPPTTLQEEKLVQIWSQILGVERIGVSDHFFELGGNSLKAVSLIGQVFKQMNVKVPLREIFEHPTVLGLANYIATAQKEVYRGIEPVELRESYPLSSAQKRLFILNQMGVDNTGYNLPGVLLLDRKLDPQRLEEALLALIDRHQSLRTSFSFAVGEPVQQIQPAVNFRIEELKMSEMGIEDLMADFVRPFDLGRAPLFRVGLARTVDGYILTYDIHHIIADGISLNLLIGDLFRLYAGETLPESRIQYRDFAVWQNQLMEDGLMEDQKNYWLERFADQIPTLDLPTDYLRPKVMQFVGDEVDFELTAEMTAHLKLLAKRQGVTLYMVLLAVYNIFLARYTGQEDLIIGSPIAGRDHADLEQIIGMFVNTLALRNQPIFSLTFTQFLKQLKENTLNDFQHQDYQFELLVDQLNLERDLSRNPLFDTMFVYHNLYNPEVTEGTVNDFKLQSIPYKNKAAKFDLTLIAREDRSGLEFKLAYNTMLFRRETVERMAGQIKQVIDRLISDPEISIGELELILPEEKFLINSVFNQTAGEFPRNKTIGEVFEEHVTRTPEKIAVISQTAQLTYHELNARINQLARLLRERGVYPEQIVAIIPERNLEMIIGILGIIKAGGAYLPIDPEYPPDRVEYMLADSRAQILLTHPQYFERAKSFTGTIIDLKDPLLGQYSPDNPELVNQPTDLVYIIYTSGSTGKPKGVMLEHRGLLNLNTAYGVNWGVSPEDRVLQFASCSFDSSVSEITRSILFGNTLCMLPKEIRNNYLRFAEYINQYQITNVVLPPVYIQNLRPESMPTLRMVITAGSASNWEIVNTWKDHVQYINAYGPTEYTVCTSIWKARDKFDYKVPPIGRPILNTRVYILNQNQQLQPIGVIGELCIGGAGLARGYLNRPELTAEKFIPSPLNPAERIYRTGDLARWLPDGQLEFVGRIDHQVKLRGFRIELGEIENRIVNHQQVTAAAVLLKGDNMRDQYLCAYYTGEEELTDAVLRAYLEEQLPGYMVPSYFVKLNAFPLTTSGKINRHLLPEPERTDTGIEYVAPTTELEETLVHIWSEILQIKRVGILDNFFALGGHSLKAASLISKVYQEFALQLPLQEIFKHPTIRELANLIRFGTLKAQQVDPYLIFNAGQEEKLFCFPSILGYGITYQQLANALAEYTVYSFDFIERDEPIAEYIAEMQKLQPQGSYTLIGYSAGGNLAFEVARVMEAQGLEVAGLIMLDSLKKDAPVTKSKKDLETEWLQFARTNPDLAGYLEIDSIRRELIQRVTGYQDYCNRMINNGTVQTPIHLIKAQEEGEAINTDSWQEATHGGYYVYQGQGSHRELLSGENLQVNARLILDILK